MSYIEATDTSLRKTGQIKLHGARGFAACARPAPWSPNASTSSRISSRRASRPPWIDEFVRDFAFSHGAYPATLMYRGYRYSTCTSINHRSLPRHARRSALKEGDIVNIDVTSSSMAGRDSSRMYVIGPIARKAERLIEVTYATMMTRIATVKPGPQPATIRSRHPELRRTRRA